MGGRFPRPIPVVHISRAGLNRAFVCACKLPQLVLPLLLPPPPSGFNDCRRVPFFVSLFCFVFSGNDNDNTNINDNALARAE